MITVPLGTKLVHSLLKYGLIYITEKTLGLVAISLTYINAVENYSLLNSCQSWVSSETRNRLNKVNTRSLEGLCTTTTSTDIHLTIVLPLETCSHYLEVLCIVKRKCPDLLRLNRQCLWTDLNSWGLKMPLWSTCLNFKVVKWNMRL